MYSFIFWHVYILHNGPCQKIKFPSITIGLTCFTCFISFTLPSGNHHFVVRLKIFLFFLLCFSKNLTYLNKILVYLSSLTYFTQHNSFKACPCCEKQQDFIFDFFSEYFVLPVYISIHHLLNFSIILRSWLL